ncbi:MAG: DUF4330 family protein [Clostridia bacterium]
MKPKKINLLDILIVFCIAVIILGVVFRAEIKHMIFSDENSKFSVEFKIEDIENARAALFTAGSKLTLFDTNTNFGEITQILKTPKTEIYIIDGIEKTAQSVSRSDVTITVSVPGYISSGIFYSNNGTELLVSSILRFETDNQVFSAKILAVQKNILIDE